MQGWFELLEAFVRAHPIWVGFGVAGLALQAAVVAVSTAWAPRWDERTISLNEGAMTEVPPWHESRLAYIEDTDYRLAQEDWPRLMKRLTLYAYLVEEVGDPDKVPDTDAMSDDEVDQELVARGAECRELEERGRELSKRARERALGQWETTPLGMWRRVRH